MPFCQSALGGGGRWGGFLILGQVGRNHPLSADHPSGLIAVNEGSLLAFLVYHVGGWDERRLLPSSNSAPG